VVEIDISHLVDKLIIASLGQQMTTCPWKVHGQSHVTHFIFWGPIIFLESSNFVYMWTILSNVILGMTNCP